MDATQETLRSALSDEDFQKETLWEIIEELSNTASDAIVALLKENLSEPEMEKFLEALDYSIDTLSNKAIAEEVAKHLSSENKEIRFNALKFLGQTGDPSYFDLVADYIEDKSSECRNFAIGWLVYFPIEHKESILSILLKTAEDGNDLIRSNSFQALGEWEDERAHKALQKAAETDNDPDTRQIAKEVLAWCYQEPWKKWSTRLGPILEREEGVPKP